VLILSGGEPLLRKDIGEIIQYGSALGLRMAIGTSGTLIDRGVAKKLHEYGISSVAISLDSPTPELHDRFRGLKGAWQKAVRGITSCRSEGIQVQINTTVSSENFSELHGIVSLGRDLGVNNFQVFFIVPVGRAAGSKSPDPARYEAMIRDVVTTVARPGISVRPTCAPQFMRIARESGLKYPDWQKGCIAGLSYCRICPDGEVTPCPYLPVSGGNVRKTPFNDIWTKSPVFKSLRDPDAILGKCGSCEYRNVCGGCRARAYGVTSGSRDRCGRFAFQAGTDKGYLGEDPVCTYLPGGEITHEQST
jgi:radical SAM protein with 4Fe4S-binding SPASM domain